MNVSLLVLQLAVIILVTRTCGVLIRYLRLPEVIGEMIGGIMLGPSLLGLIAHGSLLHGLFPDDSIPALNLLSELGLMFFMFIVGLELNLRSLRGRGRAVLTTGLASLLIPFIGGLLLARYLSALPIVAPVHHPTAFVLMIATVIAVSAFPVMARVLSDQSLLKTKVGSMAMASAAVIDVGGWCLLAVVYDIASTIANNSHVSAWWSVLGGIRTAALAVAYALVMMMVLRRFLWRFQTHFESRGRVTRNALALVIVLMFASALVTDYLHVNLIFGAFMLGAILPSEDMFVRHLAEKLQDVTLVVLMPVFFTLIGLRTNFAGLYAHTIWHTVALMLPAMFALKFFAAAGAGRLNRMSIRESSLLGVLMNTHGVMELVVLNLAWELHVIHSQTMAIMVLALLTATLLAAPLISLLGRPWRKSPDLAVFGDKAGHTRVLVCISQMASVSAILEVGRLMLGPTGSRLHVLELETPSSHIGLGLEAAPDEGGPIEAAQRYAAERKIEIGAISFPSRRIGHDIVRTAAAIRSDWLIVGSHRGVLGASAMGGVAGWVMRHAACHVGILVAKNVTAIKRVLVPYVGEEQDAGALLAANMMSQHAEVEVTILHVVRPHGHGLPDSPMGVRSLVDRYMPNTSGGRQIRMQVIEHHSPADVVIEESSRHDLVILGASPLWRLRERLLGFSQESVAVKSRCSVLIVHTGKVRSKAATADALAGSHAAVSPAAAEATAPP
ncbi:MAG: universal stress protein [Phycisphaerales bacterium]|nr:universal stress protein [Phycisphaerales bacterium]